MKSVTRIGVWSCAKISGVLYAFIGLIEGAIFALIPLGAVGSLTFGAASIIILPIFFGIVGLITGAIMAFLYNSIVRWTGGIKIEIK